MAHTTKPPKPWPGYPLYAHRNGQWAKRIRGKLYYFGRDAQQAYERYLRERGDLEAGRAPSRSADGLTVGDLVNLCLAAKLTKVDSGELTRRNWEDYRTTAKRIIKVFGRDRLVDDLTPADFTSLRMDLAKTHKALQTIAGDIQRVRMFFNWGYKEGLLEKPLRFGSQFAKPSRAAMRRDRQRKPPKLFTADQISALLAAAGHQLRSMILLGINAGFGNTDCALLTTKMIAGNWINSPRSKTATMRRIPLWPETVQSLEAVLASRKPPKDPVYADRVFITSKLSPWESDSDRPISKEFTKLLKKTNLRQPGLTFYALRHTFATVGKQSRDNDAVRAILGHVVPANDILSSHYDEAPVDDRRLLAVTEHVREWLFKQTERPSGVLADPAAGLGASAPPQAAPQEI